jgi:hypothetical protein
MEEVLIWMLIAKLVGWNRFLSTNLIWTNQFCFDPVFIYFMRANSESDRSAADGRASTNIRGGAGRELELACSRRLQI